MFNQSRVFRSLFIGCSLCFCFVISASAQDPAPKSDASVKLAAETQKIKEQIVKIGTGNDITIVRRDGQSFHGSITKINTDSVMVNEVDLRANVELNYQQIKKVDKGYSPVAPLTGQRMPPKKRKIIGWIALGGLAVIVVLIVRGLNDPNF